MTFQDLPSFITAVTVVCAGAWSLFRFGISREPYPKLQFDLELNQLGKSRDRNIIELIATITNKGISRQYIHLFKFNILVFDDTMPFDEGDSNIEKRLKFLELEKGLNWVSTKHPTFIDGGMSHRFAYVTSIDERIRFVMIYSKFDQDEKRWGMKRSEHYRISKAFAIYHEEKKVRS
ncbi:MAG: hypothetical protein ABIQ02_04080 [Saprospiraceae bacterium]